MGQVTVCGGYSMANSLKTKFFNNDLNVSLMINDKYSQKANEEGCLKAANGRVIKGGNE